MLRRLGLIAALLLLPTVAFAGLGGVSGGGGGGSVTTAAGLNTNFGLAPETFGAKGDGQMVNDATLSPAIINGTTQTTFQAPEQDTDQANEYVINLFAYSQGTGTFTPPGSPTQLLAVASSSTTQGLWVGDTLQASVGQVALQSGTITAGVDFSAGSVVIAPSGGTITLGNITDCVAASNSACTVNVPSGTSNGDLLVMIYSANPAISSSGTFVNAQTLLRQGGVSGHLSMRVGYRVANSEPASYQLSSIAEGQSAIILDIKNATIDFGITSVQSAFAAGDAGKLTCMDGTSPNTNINGSKAELCGTISSVVNSHYMVPSFNATSGNGAPSTSNIGYELKWATDDCGGSNALQGAINAAATESAAGTLNLVSATGGGTVSLGFGKAYGCSQSLVLPGNVTVKLIGSGATEPVRGVRGGVSFNPGQWNNNGSSSSIWWLTTSLGSSPALSINPGNTTLAGNLYTMCDTHDSVENLELWGGAGMNWDGAGSTSDGVKINNNCNVFMNHVIIGNFGGDCVHLLGTSGTNIAAGTDMYVANDVETIACKNDAYEIDATQFSQNVNISNSTVEYNGHNGVEVDGTTPQLHGLTLTNDIIQRDDASGAGSIFEVKIPGSATVDGCTMLNTYFEKDTGSIAGFVSDSNGQCTRIGDNYCGGGSCQKGFTVNQFHMAFAGPAPSITSSGGTCGTTDSVTAGSTDQVGQFTTGTGTVSSCVITFANAFANAPKVAFGYDETAGTWLLPTKATGSLTFTTSNASHVIDYFVLGPQS